MCLGTFFFSRHVVQSHWVIFAQLAKKSRKSGIGPIISSFIQHRLAFVSSLIRIFGPKTINITSRNELKDPTILHKTKRPKVSLWKPTRLKAQLFWFLAKLHSIVLSSHLLCVGAQKDPHHSKPKKKGQATQEKNVICATTLTKKTWPTL